MTNIYYGIVEDRDDPLKIGRVRVRIHQIHSDDKQLLSTPDLPWSQVIHPTTSASLSGLGTQHGLVEGSTVAGFFRDDEMQDFVVFGSTAGYPQQGSRITAPKGEQLGRTSSRGFNDPRRIKLADYNGTPDGPNPQHEPRRGWGLTLTLDEAPRLPKTIDIDYTGKGTTITELTDAELEEQIKNPQSGELRGLYPLYFDKSDYDERARGEHNDGKGGEYKDRDLPPFDGFRGFRFFGKSARDMGMRQNPKYPYNKTMFSESGHFLEIDDTFGAERISYEHRTGTFHEIDHEGNEITRIVGSNYEVIAGENSVAISGKCNVHIGGDAKIHADGDVDVTSYGDGKIDVAGKMDIESGKDMTLRSARFIRLSARKVIF